MKLPQIQRILREDIPDAPSWITKLLTPLNTFIDTMYTGLNKDITLDQNINCQFKDFSFITAATYVASATWTPIIFKRTIKGKAKGVMLVDIRVKQDYFSPITAATGISWQEINGNIQIEHISGLANSTEYTGRVLII